MLCTLQSSLNSSLNWLPVSCLHCLCYTGLAVCLPHCAQLPCAFCAWPVLNGKHWPNVLILDLSDFISLNLQSLIRWPSSMFIPSSGAKITTQSTLSICADLRGPVPLGSFRPILGSPTPVFHTLSPTSTPWHLPAIYLQTHPNNDQCMSMNYPHEIVLPTSWDHSGYSLTSSAIRSLNHCDIWS